MLRRIKLALATLMMGILPLAPATVALAEHEPGHTSEGVNIENQFCAGSEFDATALEGGGAECAEAEGATTTVGNIAVTVVNIFTWVVGVIAVIMIIVGGFRYITSGGDSSKVGGAKNAIVFAIVGLIIVILAQVIVRFVVDRVDTDSAAPAEPSSSLVTTA
jgi:hypothetical protein